ncbi:hypothetical protein F5146DRAFT_1000073 [Armillaria mellea]|nr:hypothetical protein F5146DRAFT_1000073 [Armillaria mellea]
MWGTLSLGTGTCRLDSAIKEGPTRLNGRRRRVWIPDRVYIPGSSSNCTTSIIAALPVAILGCQDVFCAAGVTDLWLRTEIPQRKKRFGGNFGVDDGFHQRRGRKEQLLQNVIVLFSLVLSRNNQESLTGKPIPRQSSSGTLRRTDIDCERMASRMLRDEANISL